ncbi:MAG: c-type cytochrome [Candidatus Methylomirabilales bacterium]
MDRPGSRTRPRSAIVIVGSLILFLAVSPAHGQESADYFKQNCAACHTIGGGRLVGPDLKDSTQRKDRAWLIKFLQDPKAMIESGDPYARQLREEARGVIMPTAPGMTPQRAGELLDYIEATSRHAARNAGPTAADRPSTPQDVALGRDLFHGQRPLANGGPACVGCHALGTVGGLGGGTLAPDLTRVYERLGGRTALAAWLAAPPTPTMQAAFREHPLQPEEVQSLLAVIEDAAQVDPAAPAPSLGFLALGFLGMAVALGALQAGWRRRLTAVRRPLAQASKRGDA